MDARVKPLNEGATKNRFRFQRFSERVSNINVDVFHRVGAVAFTPAEGSTSFFQETLFESHELNLTRDFREFFSEVVGLAESLPLLLHNKEKVVDAILRHLSVPKTMAFKELLRLSVCLSKDLQEEFFPFLPRLLNILSGLLDPLDSDTIEEVFTTIAYFFKFLLKPILRNLNDIFRGYLPFIGHKKDYIRQFAAESFAFLLRKVKDADLADHLCTMISIIGKAEVASEEIFHGLSLLLFESVKGTKQRLHSRASSRVATFLSCFAYPRKELQDEDRFTIISKALFFMVRHSSADNASDVVNLVISHITSFTSVLETGQEGASEQLAFLVRLLARIAEFRSGGAVSDPAILLNVLDTLVPAVAVDLKRVAGDGGVDSPLCSAVLSFASAAFSAADPEDTKQHAAMLDAVFKLECPKEILALCVACSSQSVFDNCLLHRAMNLLDSIAPSDLDTILWFVTALCCAESGDTDPRRWSLSSSIVNGRLAVVVNHTDAALKKVKQKKAGKRVTNSECNIVIAVLGELKNMTAKIKESSSIMEDCFCSRVWAVLACLRFIDVPAAAAVKEVNNLCKALDVLVDNSNDTEKNQCRTLRGHASLVLASLLRSYGSDACGISSQQLLEETLSLLWRESAVKVAAINSAGSAAEATQAILRGAKACLSAVTCSQTEALSSEMQLSILKRGFVHTRFDHKAYAIRLLSCEILDLFEPAEMLPPKSGRRREDDPVAGPCPLMELFRVAAEGQDVLFDIRTKELQLQRIASIAASQRLPPAYEETLPHFYMGLFRVKVRTLWPAVITALSSYASTHFTALWPILFARLTTAVSDASVFSKTSLESYADTVEEQKKAPSKKKRKGKIQRSSAATPKRAIDEAVYASRDGGDPILPLFRRAIFADMTATDDVTFLDLVLQTIASIAEYSQRKSAELVPVFLDTFITREYNVVFPERFATSPGEVDEDTIEIAIRKGARGACNAKLMAWLAMFSKFTNAHGLIRGKELQGVFHRFLGHAEPKVQRLALHCFNLWKPADVYPYRERLLRVIDEGSFREELTLLRSDMDGHVILPEHRPGFLAALIPILYAKFVFRKGRSSSKTSMSMRRANILSFLAALQDGEAEGFLEIVLAPFAPILAVAKPSVTSPPKPEVLLAASSAALNKQVGFLRALNDMLRLLAGACESHAGDFFVIVVSLLQSASARSAELAAFHDVDVEAEDDAEEDLPDTSDNFMEIRLRKELSQVRILAIRRLGQLFAVHASEAEAKKYEVFANVALACLERSIANMHREGTQHPSALVELFIVWSRSPFLVHFLAKDANIMVNILSCLVAHKVAPTVVSAVLTFVENLLKLREELEDSDTANFVTCLLRPHVQLLLDSLQSYVRGSTEIDQFARRELGILSKIGDMATSPPQATALVALLLPFINRKGTKEGTKRDLLMTVSTILGLLDRSTVESHFAYLCKLFLTMSGSRPRKALCNVMESAAKSSLPELEPVIKALFDLNAMTTSASPEPDYDLRLGAYAMIEELIPTLDYYQTLPLVYCCLHDMRDDELSLRSAAGYWAGLLIKNTAETSTEGQDKLAGSFRSLRGIVLKVIVPEMRPAMKLASVAVRNEFLLLLSSILNLFPEVYPDLHALKDEDPELDFFNNITHIQLGRKVRAMRRAAEKGAELQPATIVGVVIPLFAHFFFEATKDGDHNLSDHACAAIGSLCGHLGWGHYIKTLRLYLRLIPAKPWLEKQLVRLVCSILDVFHFDLGRTDEDVGGRPEDLVPSERVMEDKEEGNTANSADASPMGSEKEQVTATTGQEVKEHVDEHEVGEEDDDDTTTAPALAVGVEDAVSKQRRIMVTSILPELYKYLTENKAFSVVRVPVALAIAKVLLLLPIPVMHSHLPRLLITVCQHLRSRDQNDRDATRTTITSIASSLGPRYFKFIVLELRTALQRGYQLHILGYTVHSLLDALMASGVVEPGSLDYCADVVMEVAVEDIFGNVAAEKEVNALAAKMKEAKTSKSHHSVELLGKVVGFHSLEKLLAPIRAVLESTVSLKTTRLAADILRHLGMGLHSNPSIDTPNMLKLVHSLIQSGQSQPKKAPVEKLEKKPKKVSSYEVFAVQPRKVSDMKKAEAGEALNQYVFAEFGLRLLTTALKRGKVDRNDPVHLGMLDPFVPLLRSCLQSSHNDVVSLAMRTLVLVLAFPSLPSLSKEAPAIADVAFKIVRRSGGTGKEVVQSAFKLLSVVIRETSVPVEESDLRLLISFASADMSEASRQATTFSLIKAIVGRKLVIPEVYDLIGRVSTEMVQHQVASVRQLCRQVLLHFLLEYPLGSRRLKQHMEFLAKNLAFPVQSGRESVLDMVHKVVAKFPDEVIHRFSELFFTALSTRLVNDTEADVRALVGVVIKALMRRVDGTHMEAFLKLIAAWQNSPEKPVLRRLGVQLYGLAIEVMGKRFSSRAPDVVECFSKVILSLRHKDAEDEGGWEEVYFTMTALEKLLVALPSLVESDALQEVWPTLAAEGLEYHHSWVRLVACRLLGLFFAQVEPQRLGETAKKGGRKRTQTAVKEEFFTAPGVLPSMSASLCRQLSAASFDAKMGDQVVKNLVFVCRVYQAVPELGQHAPVDPIKGNVQFANVAEDGSGNGDSGSDDDGAATEEVQPSKRALNADSATLHTEKQVPGLFWIVRRLAFIARSEGARQKSTLKRTYIFRFFAALVDTMKGEAVPYLFPVLSSLFRTVNSGLESKAKTTAAQEEAVAELAQEVIDFIGMEIDTPVFVAEYNRVRNHVTHAREERRRQKAVQAIVNPEQHARRKAQQNVMKREQRKRKNAEFSNTRVRKRVKRARKEGISSQQSGT